MRGEVEVHFEPTASGFGRMERRARGARVTPTAFRGLALSVDGLLG